MSEPVTMTIPLVPPSVNHYKVPVVLRRSARNGGGTVRSFAVTPEGKAFKQMVALAARGGTIAPASERERRKVWYRLEAHVFLGAGQRGDGDNFWKCIADGLVDARVIHSDARVREWWLTVHDEDRGNPRTEIVARRIEG